MYVIFNDDGVIIGTIIGPDKSYGANYLDKENKKWLFLEGGMTLNPLTNYVDVATKTIQTCQPMALAINKMSFVADGKDECKITGIPPNSNATILCDDQPQQTLVIHDGEIDLTANAAAKYEVHLTCFKFLPSNVVIEATAQ